MRLTKKSMRDTKRSLSRTFRLLTQLSHEQLMAHVKTACGIDVTAVQGDGDLMYYALKWAIEDALPSHLVD